MLKKLENIEKQYNDLTEKLSDPSIISNQILYQKYAKQHKEIEEIVENFKEYKKLENEILINGELLKDNDGDIRELAKSEIETLKERLVSLEKIIHNLMIPKDPLDVKNIFLEIRAGTGGEEAALFAYDLFRMYSKFSEKNGWKVELVSVSPTGVGGFKEVIVMISGKNVYSKLKYEGGVHRVQRVPQTEAYGRIHTSAVTVAVLAEADEIDIKIDDKDLKIDVFRSSGPGGQSVNTTDSAVRVTHIPTGLVVSIQDEKSQHKNKAKALKILRARLYEMEIEKQKQERAQTRKSMVGSGDRSEKIRTYNFPQGRVTDHRIGLSLYRLESILDGDFIEVVESLQKHFQAEALKDVDKS